MSVRVAVRFQPDLGNNANEPDEIEQNLLIYPQLNCVNVARHFNLYFHDVLPLYSTQDEVFNIVQPLVDDFLQGNNISIITYGPAGCGKTYTMFGNGGTQTNPENVYRLGLMPRVISYIFDQLQQRFNPSNGQFIYQLQCTFAEIYNKKIIDLLNPYHRNKHSSNNNNTHRKKVKFIQKQNGSYDYQNLTKVTISSIADVLRFMYQAFHNRKYVRKYTQNNQDKNKHKQSKSHCVATLKLIFKKKDTNELYKVSMIFIDCGAYCKSVPINKNNNGSGSASEDSQYINRAFLSLGNVITGLHRESQTPNNNRPNNAIPWKDNILTQTLHSLCMSNTPSKILLFLNCSLSAYVYEETLATLRFGNLAMTDPMLLNVMDNYRKKIKSLHTKISKYKLHNNNNNNNNDNISVSQYSHSHESNDTNDTNNTNNETLKSELYKLKKEHKKTLKELNNMRLETNETLSMLDYKNSQMAAMELSSIELKNELLKLQTNEQLLRDENQELQHKLQEINSMKQNKLQFIDHNLMKRTSVIHSTLKRGMLNNKNTEQSKMIDELSSQIEDLQNLKAELQYNIATKDDKIKHLSSKQESDRQEQLKLQQEILNYKTNYILQTTYESEQNQLLEQIKERDFRISEYERDMKENLYESSNWKETQKTYEQTIKQLQQQLKESKHIIQQQHQQSVLGKNNPDPLVQQNMNMNMNETDSTNATEEIRNLKLEIARIKSNVYKNEQIARLKRKNNALEGRLIKARSEKAKMLPSLLREKTELKAELIEMKTTLALYLVKWKFIEKKYIKQIRDCRSDLERYQRKLDNQIKGKRKLGNQMEMLDKIAQDTVKTAIHQRVISSINTNHNSNQNNHNIFDFDSQQPHVLREDEIDSVDQKTQDYNDENNQNSIYNATLPENLRRVQNVIKDLTTKLQKKQTRITELENKMALLEFSASRSSNLGRDGTMVAMHQFMRGQSASIYGSIYGMQHASRPSTTATHTAGTIDHQNSNMFNAFSSTTTDLQLSMTQNSSVASNSSMPEPSASEYKTEFKTEEEELSMIANQEQYLKAFLTNQVKAALPPTPEKTLSLGFFVCNSVNKKKNIRISVDVNRTFYEILSQLQVKKPSNRSDLELHIELNPEPIESRIIVTNDLMNKTFWDLILEFGIFSLLKFSVITNAMALQKNTLQIQNKNEKKTSIFKRFKSKKNVSK